MPATPLDGVSWLLARTEDLLHLRVRLSGCDAENDALVVRDGGGRAEVTFPPQATGEEAYEGASPVRARRGGTSRLTFALEAHATAPLTAAGLLDLLRGAPLVDDDPAAQSVELPWRLRMRPEPAITGDAVRANVPGSPHPGPDGAHGLWQLRLEAAGGLAMVPTGVDDDSDPTGVPGVVAHGITPPLDQDLRSRVLGEGAPPQAPPTARHLDLGALGGTIEVGGNWPTFGWQQQVVLGRDQAIRVEAQGWLYPWGHPAVLSLVATREVAADPESGPADGVAGLQVVRTLTVTEPVRTAADDAGLARALPFDRVEVVTPVVPVPSIDAVVRERRAPKDGALDRLTADRDAAQVEERRLAEEGWQLIVDRTAELAVRRDEVLGSLEGQRLQALKEAASWQGSMDELQAGGGPFAMTWDEMRIKRDEANASATAFYEEHERERGYLDAEASSLAAQASALQQGVDPGPDASYAGPWWQQHQHRQYLDGEVERVTAELAEVHAVAHYCLDEHGQPLHLPLRLDGVETSSVALFVHDISLPDSPHAYAFEPLRDPALLARIAHAWSYRPDSPSRELVMPGTPVDLVRAGPVPMPSDLLPLHRLSITGVLGPDGELRAVVTGARVALRAVQELVPSAAAQAHEDLDDAQAAVQGAAGLTDVQFGEDYLAQGLPEVPGLREALAHLPQPFDPSRVVLGELDAQVRRRVEPVLEQLRSQVALELVEVLPIDFRTAADQSGGLVSPVLEADVLSRLAGPVDLRSLPLDGRPPDLAAVFADATLLGLPLRRLLDTAGVPRQLSLVTTPDGGVRMTWPDVTLTSHGPFVATAETRLDVTVERGPALTRTTCRLRAFTLKLPPGGDALRLKFRELTYVQEPGRSPDLRITGLSVVLGEDLALLRDLENYVDLGDRAPVVRVTPQGLSASYALNVPEVTASMFVMRGIAVEVGVEVPFDGRPVVTRLCFASRERPFQLSVSVFSGTGYLVFEISEEGIRRLEAALEFGAGVAINVGIASAEVHALGGVRFALTSSGGSERIAAAGTIRIGGSVDVLGLISVMVELRAELTYDGHALTGRATAVIEVDVTLWSGRVELDSGPYTFAGSPPPAPVLDSVDAPAPAGRQQAPEARRAPSLEEWQHYRSRFTTIGAQ